MVFVTLEGVFEKNKRPSSEWQFHLDLYRSKKGYSKTGRFKKRGRRKGEYERRR